ncbi:MAG: 30S ribosomal protein S1 [Porphyromonas sp.]|nr:30S ribosomal protein S1 [Porphyromonas sp.]
MKNYYDEVKPLEGFDWDSFERASTETPEQSAELEKKYQETLGDVAEGEIVEGTVQSMDKREVVINVGFKSNGVVPFTEFRYNPDLAVGDTVEVFVETQENKDGQLILSHKRACQVRSWERINTALESEEIVKGFITSRTKGGMIVDVYGIDAFLPGSQIDVKPIRDFDEFVGKTMEFRVIKVNEEYRNVVVSHKALIEEELEAQRSEIMSKLEKGQVLEGVVKNITSYGAFVDLGGVDGLIHITDLSWGRVQSPEEVVQLDQKINVVILDFDQERNRIALGLKQLTPHPWDNLDENLNVGDRVTGKVVVITDYGAFIEIVPGVEGLLHVSEMSWAQHVRSPHDYVNVGEEIEVQILTLDRESRRMSLGLRQLTPDPWADIEQRFPVGSKHTAKVRNFTNFGIFVEFAEGIDGLIHISDLSWTKKIKHPSEFTKVGNPIEVVVLEIDKENRRLSLGHKQVEDDPWDNFASIYAVGAIHQGKVVEIMDRGAVVALPYEVEGFATPKHLTKEDGSQAKLGEELDFKVIEFNRDARRIIVSHSRIHEDALRGEAATTEEEIAEAVKASATVEKSTLGDIDALAALRDKLEDQATSTEE